MKLNARISCREALVILAKMAPKNRTHTLGQHNLHVDFRYIEDDLDLPLDDWSQRFVMPAMQALAGNLAANSKLSSAMFETPSGMDAASERYENIAMRCVLSDGIARFEIGVNP